MQAVLIKKLHDYIRQNNPDILLQLEEAGTVTEYLSNKVSTVNASLSQLEKVQPAYIIDEACMNVLTQDLRPSKFNYITTILEEEFTDRYQHLQDTGILKFEVINLITKCQSTFDDLKFSEANEDNRFIRYAITGVISEYFESNK